ncbi:MAG TPA: hypothetical protein PLD25_19885 [Chloroflexota bacterium]|nr:hypothetical protein [Chloroflexota bacterium]HUM68694.1 hypothetical protein [Chloroflexota bacterium]
MNTTNIFVEILIVGIQASVWTILLVLSIFGVDWLPNSWSSLNNWNALVTIIVLATWYTLGIISDRIASVLFSGFANPKKTLQKFAVVRNMAQISDKDIRVAIMYQEEKVSSYLEYFRSRARIVRATTLNLLLITVFGSAFVLSRCSQIGCMPKASTLMLIIGMGALLTLTSWIIHGVIEIGYENRMAQVGHKFKEYSPKSHPPE